MASEKEEEKKVSYREIRIPGRPVPQGSLRAMKTPKGSIVTPQSHDVLVYRGDIRAAWGKPQPMTGEVAVIVEFVFTRPKYHFDSKGKIKDEYVGTRPTGKPDIDKLLRSVLDALTDYAYFDDSQVDRVSASKHYGPENLTNLTVLRDYILPAYMSKEER